ncbi:MAG TPA: acetate--CoA ligase family protein, partial [Thermoanaerobaculia bacterium]|nr:acetate--CoA ligase family protein [Thermoanaerobaculia bacterium]
KVMAEGRAKLSEVEALGVCEAYGIKVAAARLAKSPDEAAGMATATGFPVVMKIVSPDIVHKSDSGGVVVGVATADEARETYERIVNNVKRAEPDATIDGVLVQQMVKGGRETICGIVRDPVFGPLVMFGLGGIYVEVLRDVIFRVAPLTTADARNMVTGIRGSKLLDALRGQPAVSRDALMDALRRLSHIAVDFPMIEEMDINPLLAFEEDAIAVDCRVRIALPKKA